MSRRRRFLLVAAGALLLLLSLPVLMSTRSSPPPPLDPGLSLEMPDGSTTTLEELVARAERAGAEPEAVPGAAPPSGPDSGAGPPAPQPEGPVVWEPDPDDLYELGLWHLAAGRLDEAVALLRSVPEGHPRHARAMRMLGWDLYTRRMQDPVQGIWFVNKSLAAEPFEGNAWQDAYRVYWASVFD